MASLFGRKVVDYKTNKSGGSVVKGDVLIPDPTNDNAFTTTTSAAYTGGVWIADEAIANNVSGRVVLQGHVTLVNVNASVTRGNYGATHTVAKQAADAGASRTVGTFCRFTTGGTTPEADIWPVDLLGTSLSNPMTTAGDLIVGGASGTPARLADVAVGSVLKSGGVGVAPAWGLPFAANRQQDLSTVPWWAINSDQVTPNGADRCGFYPFIPLLAKTVTTFNFYVTVQNGNIGFGIFDASLTRVGVAASFACPATGIQTKAMDSSGSVALVAGALYYIAFWASGTTARLRGVVPASAIASGMVASSSLGVCAYLNTAGGVPAGPVTPSGYDLAFIPFVSMT